MNLPSPIDLYKSVYGLTDDDLEPGEREKIERVENLFEDDRRGFELRPEECALIVVDMQNFFVHPDSPARCYEATRQLPRISALCDEMRELGVPVIFTKTQHAPDVDRRFRERPGRTYPILQEDTWDVELCEELKAQPGERVIASKHTYDAFEGTDLDFVLRSSQVQTVIICGTNTDRCCETTARRAYAMQYQVMFGSDVNSTDSGLQQMATLRGVRYGYGRVSNGDEIVAELRANQRARVPVGRTASAD